MKKVWVAVLLAFVAAGCAAVGSYTQADLKRDPQRFEKEAKEIFKEIVDAWMRGDRQEIARWDPTDLTKSCKPAASQERIRDLRQEAIWIGKDSIRIRVSWHSKQDLPNTQHAANFVFAVTSPMVLTAIEDESPFGS